MTDARRLAPALAVFCALFLAAAGCTNNPATGGSMFSLVSENEERAIGAEHHPELLNEYGLYEEHPRINAYVAMVSARILAASDISSQVLTVTVLDTDMVNAFALPGGYIYVTRGLLALANNEAELAGVIGHELAHVAEAHGLKQVYRSLGTYLAVAVIFGDVGPVLNDLLLEGGLLFSLAYSREHESEADRIGLALAAKAGYDPAALARFFEQLDDNPGFTGPGWLSTHPSNQDRIAEIKRLASEVN